MMMLMMLMLMMLYLGTVVYCLDADKKEMLVQINLLDSLPTSSLSANHCNQDKLKGTSVCSCISCLASVPRLLPRVYSGRLPLFHSFHMLEYFSCDCLHVMSLLLLCGLVEWWCTGLTVVVV